MSRTLTHASFALGANLPRRSNSLRVCVALLSLGYAATLGAGVCRAEFTTMWNNGPSSNRVDMVFMGDGYTSSQINTTYVSHINSMLSYMFLQNQDPFPRYQNYFNVHRIDLVSNQSGADIPPQGIFRDTILHASYYGDGTTDRLLTINSANANILESIHLDGAGFTAEMRMVTVNSTRYGGSGGKWAVFAGGNFSAADVALHEMAHSFGGLADEYDYGNSGPYLGGEPSEPNITKDPSGSKWSHWLGYNQPGVGIIGAYEGAGYHTQGLYRPSESSKMRELNRPFDAVSREQLILEIYGLVDPLDSWLANEDIVIDSPLWVDVIDPDVISVEWYVNHTLIAGASGEKFSLTDFGFSRGIYTVTARAFDGTDWVRKNRELLEQEVTWFVQIVPEPSAAWLLIAGCAALPLWNARKPRRLTKLSGREQKPRQRSIGDRGRW